MFNLSYLHTLREFEYQLILRQLEPNARVLELGGGSGYQAKRLSQDGFDVESIDVENSVYANSLQFPVKVYDGRHLPFADASIDIIFSSNVLEHIPQLSQLHTEIHRVLKPGGYCVHVMPTGVWRFWSIITHYIDLSLKVVSTIANIRNKPIHLSWLIHTRRTLNRAKDTFFHGAIVPRHGEFGNAFTEIARFKKTFWLNNFAENRFEIMGANGIGIFYTGYMVFGARLSLASRKILAILLGSACIIYIVKPRR